MDIAIIVLKVDNILSYHDLGLHSHSLTLIMRPHSQDCIKDLLINSEKIILGPTFLYL